MYDECIVVYNVEQDHTYCKIILLFVLLDWKEPGGESADHWVYVSDTYVQVVPESRALGAQAYLLFYERIL